MAKNVSNDCHQIDRHSYQPAYSQLVDILQEQIARGIFKPGDLLPSESQLCEQYGLSPMTIRRAISILLDRGLVTTAQGQGTFVKAPDINEAIFNLRQLNDYFIAESKANVKLLEAHIIPADEKIASKLCINKQEWVVYIRQLVLKEKNPISYHQEYMVYDPSRPIIESELEMTSLHGLLTSNGNKVVQSGSLTIEAATVQNEEASYLHIEPGSPVFSLEHLFLDYEGIPVSWGWFYLRGDCIKFETSIGVIAKKNISGSTKEK
jgi:DNA-binding GntR family transcriptional regulator